jgi:hypothetical protein
VMHQVQHFLQRFHRRRRIDHHARLAAMGGAGGACDSTSAVTSFPGGESNWSRPIVVQLHRSVPYTLLGLESEVRFDLTEEQKLLEQTVREIR